MRQRDEKGRGEGQGEGQGQKRVLIVEDDDNIRTLLSDLLSDEGYLVETAPNGTLGYALAHAHPPDLILLDIMMPGMTGMQMYRMLQDNPALAAVPVVFESAVTRTGAKVDALTAGESVHDYIEKPFDADELLARVAIALRTRVDEIEVEIE